MIKLLGAISLTAIGIGVRIEYTERVISKKPLREFWELHPESRPMLEDWFRKAFQTEASSFPALRQTFGSADYLDGFTILTETATVFAQSYTMINSGFTSEAL